MARNPESLKSLGHKTSYSQDYAPEVLETFENQHPDNDYWVRFNCPEFTTLCPITGQPDFAEIRISYIPDRRMVESKTQGTVEFETEVNPDIIGGFILEYDTYRMDASVKSKLNNILNTLKK